MTAGDGASAARRRSMDIPAVQVDGNDVMAVHAAAAALVREVRAGAGPRLLHALTYRVKGHVSVDPAAYRDPEELKAALATDPIARARQHYLALPGAQAGRARRHRARGRRRSGRRRRSRRRRRLARRRAAPTPTCRPPEPANGTDDLCAGRGAGPDA